MATKEYFPGIGKIKFEGKESKNPMAFRYYDADKVIIEGMTHLLKQSEVTDPQRQKTTIYMDAAAPVSEKLVTVMADFIRRI